MLLQHDGIFSFQFDKTTTQGVPGFQYYWKHFTIENAFKSFLQRLWLDVKQWTVKEPGKEICKIIWQIIFFSECTQGCLRTAQVLAAAYSFFHQGILLQQTVLIKSIGEDGFPLEK